MQGQLAEIDSMTTSQASELLRDLMAPPPYVDASDNSLEKGKEKIEQFLSNKEIDWLLARFGEMSVAAQNKFLEAAKALLQNKS
jgi:hypothetical protein